MSWGISIIGKPESVVEELIRYGDTLTGQSEVEFRDALPHLAGLVHQNFLSEKAPAGWMLPTVHLEASGSGSTHDGVQTQRQCQVTLKALYAKLV